MNRLEARALIQLASTWVVGDMRILAKSTRAFIRRRDTAGHVGRKRPRKRKKALLDMNMSVMKASGAMSRTVQHNW